MEPATDKQKGLMDNLGITYHSTVTKEQAKTLIEEKLGKSQKTFTPKSNFKATTNGNNTTYYVSYCKDIFLALLDAQKEAPTEVSVDVLMGNAIQLVQSAKQAFE